MIIHRDELRDDEVCIVQGMPATTRARTGFDLGRRKGLKSALIRLDALGNATGLMPQDVDTLIPRHPGVRGMVQLLRVLALMDPGAESPQETRTRLVLVDAGLPKPQTQIKVRDYSGYAVARVDMGYEEFKVGVEYDGIHHWDPKVATAEIDRHARLLALGWRIVRVSAEILRYRPHTIVRRTCDALAAAGAQWPVIARFSSSSVA